MQLPLGRLTAALIAIVAIAAVAASVPIVVETPSDAGTGGSGGGVPEVNGSETESVGPTSAIIVRAVGFAALVLVILALLAFVLHDRRKLLRTLVTVSALTAIIVIISYLALRAMDAAANNPREPPDVAMPNGTLDGSSDSGDARGASRSPVLRAAEVLGLGIVVLGLVLVGLAARYRLRGADDADADPGATADVRTVAGDAADRIETESVESVENAVYEAWYRMTTYLPVEDPETSTPGEFAAAAIDAGLDRSDVEELTDLFESVRYGPETASTVTERRAVEILRRIESAYADSETAPAADGSWNRDRSGSGVTPPAATETDDDESTAGRAGGSADTDARREGDNR